MKVCEGPFVKRLEKTPERKEAAKTRWIICELKKMAFTVASVRRIKRRLLQMESRYHM